MDVEIKEFKLMPHGFLSYNIPMFGMRDEATEGILTGVKWIKELMGDADFDKVEERKSFKKAAHRIRIKRHLLHSSEEEKTSI